MASLAGHGLERLAGCIIESWMDGRKASAWHAGLLLAYTLGFTY